MDCQKNTQCLCPECVRENYEVHEAYKRDGKIGLLPLCPKDPNVPDDFYDIVEVEDTDAI